MNFPQLTPVFHMTRTHSGRGHDSVSYCGSDSNTVFENLINLDLVRSKRERKNR